MDFIKRYPFLIFFILGVLLRFASFFPSVIDHDESTYILIGSALLKGQTYLVDVIDTKPIGIFLLYAVMCFLSGGSIVVMRLMTTAVVALVAYLLFRLGREQGGQDGVGWATALIYVFMTSIYANYGIAPNSELFFTAFTVGAVVVVWNAKSNYINSFLAGLLLGLAFLIKYVCAGDALTIGLFLLIAFRQKSLIDRIIINCIPLTVGFFIPFLLTYGYYFLIGKTDAFIYYTIEVTGRYPVETVWYRKLKFMGDFALRYTPLVLFAVFVFIRNIKEISTYRNFLLVWILIDTYFFLLPGKLFGHYQIQIMPALAGLAALWFHSDQDIPNVLKKSENA